MTEAASTGKANLGTFLGVFLPCLLTILGVIMYVRLGWIAGHLGLVDTWIVITLASSITFITGLSVAAIATNMKVGGGGSYYMVSHSLGLEIGAAIGLPLFLGKAVGVAFYAAGFAESVQLFFPELSLPMIATASVIVLAVVSLLSAQLAAKSQIPVFVMIAASLVGLAFAGPPEGGFKAPSFIVEPVGFWVAFAIFFPAVTGIEAGVGLSGDLRNPRRSLPLGTISAIIISYLIYMAVPWLLLTLIPVEVLRSDPLAMREVMPHAALFYCGIWGAALSSALVNFLAAPRTLQRLARDRILPGFLGHGSKKDDTPRVATVITLAIALGAVWLGDLNEIAEALSLFFLTTYGLLNFAAAVETILDNPSWRPTFRVKWWISMLGAIGSFTAMFFLSPLISLMAVIVGVAIYMWVHQRHLNRRWEDIRTGLWLFLARTLLYRLRDYEPDIRNWRPNLLVFSGAPTRRWYLVELAQALSQNRGILTLATLIREDESEEQAQLLEESLNQLFEKRGVTALTRVHRTENLLHGMRELMKYYGIGPIRPNTIMLGHSYDFHQRHDFIDLILHIYREHYNLILAHEGREPVEGTNPARLHLWWNGNLQNLGFMLAIAYLIRHSHAWGGLAIEIHTILEPGWEKESFKANLREFVDNARISAELHVWPTVPEENIFAEVRRVSEDAQVVLTAMRKPREDETIDSYSAYYRRLVEELPTAPLLIQVLAAEELPFFDLFR